MPIRWFFAGARAEYKVTIGANQVVVDGVEGHDVLFSVERLKFKDGLVAVDLAGNAGQAYRLYQAALDRTPDKSGLGFNVHAMAIAKTTRSTDPTGTEVQAASVNSEA